MNSDGEFSYTENKHEFFEIIRDTEGKHSEKAETHHEQKEISLAV
jgi:hypothetical protein